MSDKLPEPERNLLRFNNKSNRRPTTDRYCLLVVAAIIGGNVLGMHREKKLDDDDDDSPGWCKLPCKIPCASVAHRRLVVVDVNVLVEQQITEPTSLRKELLPSSSLSIQSSLVLPVGCGKCLSPECVLLLRCPDLSKLFVLCYSACLMFGCR